MRSDRYSPDGRLDYAPVVDEPPCFLCGLLRHVGEDADAILLDHLTDRRRHKAAPPGAARGGA